MRVAPIEDKKNLGCINPAQKKGKTTGLAKKKRLLW